MMNRNKFYVILLMTLGICSFMFYDYNLMDIQTATTQSLPYSTHPCDYYLKQVNSIHGILVDPHFLEHYWMNRSCSLNTPKIVTIAVKSEVENNRWNGSGLNLIQYSDDPLKDYWIFTDNGIRRAVPRMALHTIGNLMIPKDPKRFLEYWKRSKFIDCLNINMNRTSNSSFLPVPYSFSQIALLRDTLVDYDMYPFLIGGTLLGWYRECELIPHTMDVDFAVPEIQFNLSFEADLLMNKTKFRPKRRLGMLNDSFEYTVAPLNSSRPTIDIFFMYHEKNASWVGGTAPDGRKYRYYYPRFESYCTADLGGHLFWVTCSPEKMLEADYGPNWRQDWPTKKYGWSSSGKNIRKAGRWKASQLKDVYRTY